MRKLIMILCLAVMALFLVSCAGKASLMSTNDCDKRCANRINPMEANYRNQISGLQGANRALETQAKLAGDSTKTIAKLTKENTQYQADISRLKEQLATANQKIALTQTTGTTPATCPAMTSIATAPATAAPSNTIGGTWTANPDGTWDWKWTDTSVSPPPGKPGELTISSNLIGTWVWDPIKGTGEWKPASVAPTTYPPFSKLGITQPVEFCGMVTFSDGNRPKEPGCIVFVYEQWHAWVEKNFESFDWDI